MSSIPTIKVVLIGESGVGKTCIINQFISNKFDPDQSSSLSAQFISKTLEFKDINKTLKFDIWDTAGQERFRSLAKIFYKDAKVICLCYDITSKPSFEALTKFWYEKEIKENVEGEPVLVVVANKNDLYLSQTVPNNNGREFAKEINAIFQSTSAQSTEDINLLFDNIGHKIFNPDFNVIEKD